MNKEALKKKLAGIKQDDASTINARVDNINVSTYDLWINPKSNQLEKLQLQAKIPNYQNLFLINEEEVVHSGDLARIADIRGINMSLFEYKDQYGGYPDGLSGTPINLVNNFPKAPPAGGTCTDYYNNYWYTPTGKAKMVNGKKVFESFQLTFCLADGLQNFKDAYATNGEIVNYQLGVGKLTPQGIETSIQCPGKPEQCAGPRISPLTIDDIAKKPELQIDYELTLKFSDFDVIKNIAPPSNFVDLSTPEK